MTSLIGYRRDDAENESSIQDDAPMKHGLWFLIVVAASLGIVVELAIAQLDVDPARISIEVQPFYNFNGPKIAVGSFSPGLASKDEKEFAATIVKMRKSWEKLTFAEMYVAAIRLYDLGYRKESVYWFYSAQYRGRLFAMLVDQDKLGSIGDPGFELFHAQDAFYQLAGPFINGYGFGDFDHLAEVLQRVQKEGQTIPDFKTIYPKVLFKPESQWKAENKSLSDGMGELRTIVKTEKDGLKKDRIENGTEARFAKLKSKDLPKPPGPTPKADKPMD